VSPRRLLLVRHGRTGSNAEGRFQGQLDVPLDEVGRAQAAAAAPGLAGLGFDVLVSSDLSRATETAAAIAAVSGHDVVRTRALREMCLAGFQGLTRDEVAARYPEAFEQWRTGRSVNLPGWETATDLADRAVPAVLGIEAETAMIVSHGGTIRTLLGRILDLPPGRWSALAGLDNCHYSELVYGDGRGWSLRAHNAPAPGRAATAEEHTAGDLPNGGAVEPSTMPL
jgi:glucosyl-3-phosphoglycerate phosphatase